MIEQLTRRRLTEGSEVTANSMKPLAAAARQAATRGAAKPAVEEAPVDLVVEREEVPAA